MHQDSNSITQNYLNRYVHTPCIFEGSLSNCISYEDNSIPNERDFSNWKNNIEIPQTANVRDLDAEIKIHVTEQSQPGSQSSQNSKWDLSLTFI